MLGKPTHVTALIPLPLFYNPDEHGVRKTIEDAKFMTTAEEISREFGGGFLHRFEDDSPKGFWWNKGILYQDELAAFEVDIPERTRPWNEERNLKAR